MAKPEQHTGCQKKIFFQILKNVFLCDNLNACVFLLLEANFFSLFALNSKWLKN